MGTGYTRNDASNNIADGNVINASDLDGEFDAVQSAFNGSSGHSHDGTTGEGPLIAAGGIASNAVTTAKILDANVTTAKIADANITVAKMADNSINSDQYVDGSIDREHLAADIVDGTKIADDSINSEHYVDGSIDTAHIADAQVTLAKIADQGANSVLVRDANSSGVVSAKAVGDTQLLIGDGTGFTAAALSGDVTMANTGAVTIGAQKVLNSMLADDAVGADELAANAVVTASIVDANVTTAKIADANVTTAKIAGDAITGAKIADDAVASEHIADNAVALTTQTTGNYVATITAGTGISGSSSSEGGTPTIALAAAGAGAATYGSTDDGTKIDTITLNAYGQVTAVATGATMDTWILEDGDGTEVAITNDKEVKFVEGGGIDINWTDTDNGTDGDPYDLTFTINTDVTAGNGLTGGGTLSSSRTLAVGAGTGIDVAADAISVDVSDFMTNGSNNRVVTATGADAMNAEANMTFDGSTLNVSGAVYATGNIGLDSTDYISFSNNSHMNIHINNSNEFRFESDGDFHADGDVIAYSTTVSDERLKTDIEKIENATDKISQLNGYTFTYKADGVKSAGVIAQEVEKVLPSAVSEKVLPLKTDDGVAYKTVQYDQIIGLLIESIKELKQEINELKGV
tara:strand:+ start:4123 stop:6030 length:1908 start_codon:yes stop_codon:yes gene_type:complete